MNKVYILTKYPDGEFADSVSEMDESALRVFVFWIARGKDFDEAYLLAKDVYLSMK